MDYDDLINTVGQALGFQSNKEFTTALAYDSIQRTTAELAGLAVFVKKYQVFTEEGANRLEQILTDYMTELNIILDAERAIQALRQSD